MSDYHVYRSHPVSNKIEYRIEKLVKRIVFGSPGRIEEWEFWGTFADEETRDARLKALREYNPRETFRPINRNPYRDRLRQITR